MIEEKIIPYVMQKRNTVYNRLGSAHHVFTGIEQNIWAKFTEGKITLNAAMSLAGREVFCLSRGRFTHAKSVHAGGETVCFLHHTFHVIQLLGD